MNTTLIRPIDDPTSIFTISSQSPARVQNKRIVDMQSGILATGISNVSLPKPFYFVAEPPMSVEMLIDKFYENSIKFDNDTVKLISDNLHDLF